MKKLVLILALFSAKATFSQVIFSENFSNLNGSLPAGWSVINVDGLTPNAAVAQFTSAWIIAPDFDNTIDTVAMSTSWYTPAGIANDWLITPSIALTTGNILAWQAEAQDASFRDGYEVRISTTTPTTAGFLANPPLFSIPQENGAVWTPRTVNLGAAGYANQNVYLAWRNNSNDMFVLMVDDISVYTPVSYDVAMSDTTNYEYSIVPITQTTPIGINGVLTNVGGAAITNATMTVNVVDGLLNNVYTASSTPIPSLGVGASQAVTVPGFVPTAADLYTVNITASMTEVDGATANNTISYTVLVNDSVYARDDSNVTGNLGIGAGNGGQLGQNFEVLTTDEITSISFFLVNNNGSLSGQSITASVYAATATGTPTTLLVSTDPLIMDTTTNNFWTQSIVGGSYTLTPGMYAVVINEVDSAVTLGTTTSIFNLGTTWVNWPTNPMGTWANNEDFNFNVSYVLRPNFGEACLPSNSTVTVAECSSFTWAQNGMTYTSSGTYVDTLVNSVGCDSLITLDLTINMPNASTQTVSSCLDYTWAADGMTYSASGQYTATLTNNSGCDSIVTLNLTIGSLDNSTSTNVYTITANAANSSYQWIDCNNGNAAISGATAQAYTATANGSYAVIITDGPCADTSACVTISTIGITENTVTNAISVQPNPNNGVFSIVVNDLPTGSVVVELKDASGKLIQSKNATIGGTHQEIAIDAHQLESGIYFVTLSSDVVLITERVVVVNN